MFENVIDALEARGKRLEIRSRPDTSYVVQPVFYGFQSRDTDLEHGIHFVVLETPNLAEVVLNALQQEGVQFIRRERVKLTINNAFDEAQRQRSLASLRRKREREKLKQAGIQQSRDKVMREVIIP